MATFAIDYDGTWTVAPQAMGVFACALRAEGHRVLLVTARATGHREVETAAGPFVDRVIFSPGVPKRVRCKVDGETVDVWIDDKPEMVDKIR